MLNVSNTFKNLARSSMRPIDYKVSMSFEKAFNDAIDFFTIASSRIGGTDFIKPDDSDVVQEWDKYEYDDLSSRVLAVEWEREVDPTASINMATADVVMDNSDDYFTSGILETITTVSDYRAGKETIGSSGQATSSDIKSVSQITTTSAGIVQQVVQYCRLGSAGSAKVRGVIYSDNAGVPQNLLAQGDEVTITNTTLQWITLPFSGANAITLNPNTKYWIGFIAQDPGVPTFNYSYDSTANRRYFTTLDAYSNGASSTFSGTLSIGPLACYIDYRLTSTIQTRSPIDGFILPFRPIRIYAGFNGEVVQEFVGLTEKMPVIDKKNKTATFHCIDFIKSIYNRPIGETTLLENKRTDEILTTLFNLVGISSLQLDFDTGLETIPFAYFARNDTLGPALKKLMEVEQGRIFMDEMGMIQFKNRLNVNLTPVYAFDPYTNIVGVETRKEDDIFNVVEISGKTRELQANAEYWQSGESVRVPPGGNVEVWADFDDPVSTVDDPVYVASAVTSSFSVNTASNGSGSADPTNVTLTSSDQFGKAFKMTFHNAAATDRFITNITLWVRAATVTQTIFVSERHEDSIEKYDEQVLQINNDFFQSSDDAEDVAAQIIGSYGEYGDIYEMDVKGSPALQLDDIISIKLGNIHEDYRITKLSCSITQPMNFKQTIKVRKFIPFS